MSNISQIENFSASMALELAAGIESEEKIFENHGLSPEEGQALMANGWFAQMVSEAKRDWDSLKNTKARLRIKARVAVEESIPRMYTLMGDPTVPPAARVAAFKELKEIAGVGPKDAEGEGGSGRQLPNITITFGEGPSAGVTVEGRKKTANTEEVEDAEEVYDGDGAFPRIVFE